MSRAVVLARKAVRESREWRRQIGVLEDRLKDERDRLRQIVRGVHGALTDAGTVPVPDLDADLYEAVMQMVRERDRLAACLAKHHHPNVWIGGSADRKVPVHCRVCGAPREGRGGEGQDVRINLGVTPTTLTLIQATAEP